MPEGHQFLLPLGEAVLPPPGLPHGASLFIAPVVMPLPVPSLAGHWQCHPEAQRQVLTLPANHFGPGTANSAKGLPVLLANVMLPLVPAGCLHGHGGSREKPSGWGPCSLCPWARLRQLRCSHCPIASSTGVNSHPKYCCIWLRYQDRNSLHQSLTTCGSPHTAQPWGNSLPRDGC